MDFKPKRSEDQYIQFKKKITNKEIIKIVKLISVESLLTEYEVCYKFITDAVAAEIKKRERFEQLKKELK